MKAPPDKQPKPSPQNVRFRSVDDFLEFLPADERQIVEWLRQIVFGCIPDVTEKLAYNVPFYQRHKNICFIWPASVLWGKKKTYDGVRFGFTHGYLLQDEIRFLERGGRKQVFWRDFKSIADIDEDILKAYIYEAVMIDQELARQKRT